MDTNTHRTATAKQIQQWALLANGATPGRLHSVDRWEGMPPQVVALDDDHEVFVAEFENTEQGTADSHFFVASRTAVPAMTAALQALLALDAKFDAGEQLPLPVACFSAEHQKCWRFGIKYAVSAINEALGVES